MPYLPYLLLLSSKLGATYVKLWACVAPSSVPCFFLRLLRICHFFLLLHIFQYSEQITMDSLVATYSRPAFEDEAYSSEEREELTQITPSLSLNFALPPIRNVRSAGASPE